MSTWRRTVFPAALSVLVLATVPVNALLQGRGDGATLPEGKGRESVAALCVQCHALDTVVSQKRTREQWEETLGRMVSNGAQIPLDESKIVIEYLSDHFGAESGPVAAHPTAGATEGAERAQGPALPAGQGRETVVSKCFQCHSQAMWKALRQDHRSWQGTLYRMVGKGALWTEEEIATMAQYLFKAFGPEEVMRKEAR